MAGSITVSSITLDSDNNFSIRSNTGATILSANGTGLITGIANGASIVSAQLTTPTVSGNLSLDSTGTTGVRSPAANTLAFHTAGTEDMRIDSSGNVGIGVTATTQKLYVNGSACFPNDSKLGFHGNPSAATISNYYSGNDTSNYLTMFAGGTERMRIDSSGRVTMPYQSGFAYIVAAVSVVGSNYILFSGGSYNYNVGSILNLTGGTSGSSRVTVPVSGYYDISVSMMGETDGTRIEMFVRKNGSDLGGTNAVSTQYNNAHINGIFYLAANDYLEIYKQSGTLYNSASSNNFFTVRLLG